MDTKPKVLILAYKLHIERCKRELAYAASALDCHTPYEVVDFETFIRRWGGYDWDSVGFKLAFLKRYRKMSIYDGYLMPEDKEKYLALAKALNFVELAKKATQE